MTTVHRMINDRVIDKVYRKITANAFWNRVGEEKEDIVRLMAIDALAERDTKPSNRIRKIDNGEFVGLDDKNLQAGFNEMKLAGTFTQTEYDVIFADATIDEVPEAHK